MPKILHFADAHIDMANYGRHDPTTGLPMRVMDFLKSLDTIVDAALDEKVDLVIFAGDAYKDRNPAPTFQREWGQRIMQLSKAKIPTILLIGNHDLSPGLGRAHALEEFNTLEVPYVHVAYRPTFYKPEDLNELEMQVMALPWVARSGMMAYLDIKTSDPSEIYTQLEEKITDVIDGWLGDADPNLPTIFTAHASVQGASFGGERTVMLGGDLTLSPSLVKNNKFDYVALGHIHKPQDLNEDQHPPVIYPGSIERVDFGEAQDKKYFIVAQVEKGKAKPEWRELKDIRPFIDRSLTLESEENVTDQIRRILPSAEEMEGAVLRLKLEYPREWETLIDEAALREMTATAFEFHFVKRPQMDTRVRIPEDKNVGSMSPIELLEIYWKSVKKDKAEREELLKIAQDIITNSNDED
ncbi:MAG: exonuclease SbcCD subunit D [Chloroflexi bacterium]|nr:exonuclease SbcCD subunit D [Chloroflexota bacterium]